MAASRSLRRKMMLSMCILLDTEDDPPSRRARQRWMRESIKQRTVQGTYNNLLREFELTDEASYCNYLRLGKNTFNILLAKVQSCIEKNDTNFRRSISVGERLAITLRFLATGESYTSLHYQFRVGDKTISYIISETCQALYDVLKDDYLQVPKSEEEWMKVANGFARRWNLPHCVGALDGKHIVIKAPANSGPEFYNYKNCFSIVLMALVDYDYKFVFVDVSSNGRVADGGLFAQCVLHQHLEQDLLGIPKTSKIRNSDVEIPFFIVGDDAFPLRTYLLKPYPMRNLNHEQQIYNYRISRGRRMVENVFGIMAQRFRVFLTTIQLVAEVVELITIAACALHNFLRESTSTDIPIVFPDDGGDGRGGLAQSDILRDERTQMVCLEPTRAGRPSSNAKAAREIMKNYFSSKDRSVSWQDAMV